MKRRQLMRYAGVTLLSTIGTTWVSGWEKARAQTSGSLSVQWLGHTCFLFTSNNQRILVNPFRTLGCTAGYRSPKVSSDVVLVSSQLLDEGAVEGLPGNPKIFYQPGVYDWNGARYEGISTSHDRLGGRRFGVNTAWRWTQAGINILHLGGTAGPIDLEQKILMGRPDLLLIPVGGGQKAYGPEEAKQAIQTLNPKLAIPTHYRTQAADGQTCDIVALDEFLKLMDGIVVRNIGSDTVMISTGDLPANGTNIKVLSYKF